MSLLAAGGCGILNEFKLNKMQNSVAVALATFQVFSSHVWPVAASWPARHRRRTCLSSQGRCWTALSSIEASEGVPGETEA